MRKELESRLINLSVSIIKLGNSLKKGFSSEYLANQIIRSSCSSALNYGEVQGSESTKDFIHKLSIVIKELRETHINLKILKDTGLLSTPQEIEPIIDECNQLISIFYTSLKTAKAKIIRQ